MIWREHLRAFGWDEEIVLPEETAAWSRAWRKKWRVPDDPVDKEENGGEHGGREDQGGAYGKTMRPLTNLHHLPCLAHEHVVCMPSLSLHRWSSPPSCAPHHLCFGSVWEGKKESGVAGRERTRRNGEGLSKERTGFFSHFEVFFSFSNNK